MIEMKGKIFKVAYYCRLSNEPEKEENTKENKLQIKLNQRIKELYHPFEKNNFIPKINFDGKRKSCL